MERLKNMMTELLPLPTPEQPNPPPRPTRNDPRVVEATARAALKDVAKWLGADYNPDEDAELVEQLMGAIYYDEDGYARAHYLDSRFGWSVDFALCEILNDADTHCETHKRVVEWVTANGITPKFAVGDIVKTKKNGTGPITRVDAASALYVVCTDEYVTQHPEGNGGYLIAFEDCARLIAEWDAKQKETGQ